MPYTDFHYTPTGTGVISGKEVLEQTEDAINDLGTQISGDVQTAIDTANNALNTANTASTDAQNAVNTANTAYTTATNAQNTANTAQNTASNALTAAQNAQNDVNALGNRVTTAENNITQNTTDISGLTTRMGTAEGNITTLQNDVVTAQGTATSAQNTATLAREQAYVVRYANVAVSDNSSVPYANLNNTDNIKANDLLLDINGKIYQISAVDTANETVSVTTPLTQLAVDANVMHLSGNETVGGAKTFSDLQIVGYGTQYRGARNAYILPEFSAGYSGLAITTLGFAQTLKIGNFVLDANNKPTLDSSKAYIQIATGENNNVNACVLEPRNSISSSLGTSANKWSKIYGTEYYYGSNNVEFSTKFVTTDTAQTVSGNKTFSDDLTIYSSDTTAYAKYLNLKNQRVTRGSSETGTQGIQYQDKSNKTLTILESRVVSNGNTSFNIIGYNVDGNNQVVSDGVSVIKSSTTTNFAPTTDNAVTCGRTLSKWSDVLTYKVNNLEPSSLSLPSGNASDIIDISSYLTYLDGTANSYTVPANGWISISVIGTAIDIVSSSWSDSRLRASSGNVRILYPVLKNETVDISVSGTTLTYARFIPCQGNV